MAYFPQIQKKLLFMLSWKNLWSFWALAARPVSSYNVKKGKSVSSFPLSLEVQLILIFCNMLFKISHMVSMMVIIPANLDLRRDHPNNNVIELVQLLTEQEK